MKVEARQVPGEEGSENATNKYKDEEAATITKGLPIDGGWAWVVVLGTLVYFNTISLKMFYDRHYDFAHICGVSVSQLNSSTGFDYCVRAKSRI